MKYRIESIEDITKKVISENGFRYYCMNIKDEYANPYVLEFRSNYQFFLDNGSVWGFGSFSHRRCYEGNLIIENFEGDDMPKLKRFMALYLKALDLSENINYLENHEKKDMMFEYRNDSELEPFFSKNNKRLISRLAIESLDFARKK